MLCLAAGIEVYPIQTLDYDTTQELAVLRSCPTEQLQGILLNGAPLSLLQGPLINTKNPHFLRRL